MGNIVTFYIKTNICFPVMVFNYDRERCVIINSTIAKGNDACKVEKTFIEVHTDPMMCSNLTVYIDDYSFDFAGNDLRLCAIDLEKIISIIEKKQCQNTSMRVGKLDELQTIIFQNKALCGNVVPSPVLYFEIENSDGNTIMTFMFDKETNKVISCENCTHVDSDEVDGGDLRIRIQSNGEEECDI
jgi:hypothetical protein